MQNKLLAAISCVLYISTRVLADDDIKRGTFRFMAFIYYQDESVVDATGARFLQGAVLIRQNFLLSSSLVSSISDDPLSKTLLARVGAIYIDAHFTLNEDEDEQEQEVIQISRPRPINLTHWWASDISLLKTLQPFQETAAVHVTQLSSRQDYSDKICNIIVFKKKSSTSDLFRFLTVMPVEMLPATSENCGEQFDKNTMTCAADPQGMDSEDKSQDFCQGNSGGPLICENDVMALQTYINGNCNPPHLYQLLAPWKQFLACGVEENCNNNEKCPNICSVTLKDTPSIETIAPSEVTSETTLSSEAISESTTMEETVAAFEFSDASQDKLEPAEVTKSEISTLNASLTLANETTNNRWVIEPDSRRKLESDSENIKVLKQPRIEAQRQQTSHHIPNVASKSSIVVVQSLILSCFLMWICLV